MEQYATKAGCTNRSTISQPRCTAELGGVEPAAVPNHQPDQHVQWQIKVV